MSALRCGTTGNSLKRARPWGAGSWGVVYICRCRARVQATLQLRNRLRNCFVRIGADEA